jgi:hypothetical protein
MRILSLLIIASFILSLPVIASAVDLNGESRTYLQSREDTDDHQVLPLFEYLDFTLNDFANRELSFHFGGWVRQDLTHEQSFDNRSFNGDLQYAYVGIQKEKANAMMNLGRVLVYDGVASELVDGLSVRTDLGGNFGISAYGGIPVETDFDDRDGDAIYGGRISHELPNWYRVGLSYLKERNDSRDFRSEAGVDLRLFPGKRFELYGRSTYNGETSGWMEHAYYLTLGPFEKLRFSAEATSTNYEDYFQAVDDFSTNVFNLAPGIIDTREKLLLLGGHVDYALSDNVNIAVDYKNYDYSVADSADYYGGRITYTVPESWGAGLSLYRMDGQSDLLQYLESRVYAYKTFGKTDFTVDLFNVNYDEERNDIKNAYAAVAAVGHNLTDNARVVLDVDYSRNPSFDYDLRWFAKFVYNFSVSPLRAPKAKTTPSVEKAKEPAIAPAPMVVEKQRVAQPAVKTPKAPPVIATPPAETKMLEPPAKPAAVVQAPSDPWSARMAEWKTRLEATPTDKYTIQVEISKRRDWILGDLERLLPDYDAMVVPYQVKDLKGYTLVVGVYDSRQEGNRAVEQLPEFIRKLGPLVKTMPTIQKGLMPVQH